MAVYEIIKLGDPILREKARPVPKITANVLRLLDNMAETMRAANGVGLAAPQIGVPKRVVVVDVGDGLLELVNPELVAAEGEETAVEGCLSIPGLQGEVPRAYRVRVRYLDRQGEAREVEAEELAARALQHELDHLDGILFVDRAVRVFRPGEEETEE